MKFISKRTRQILFSLCGLLAFSIVGVIFSFISTALQPTKIPFIGILILTTLAVVGTILGYWLSRQGDPPIQTQNTLDKPFNLGTMIMLTFFSHYGQKSATFDRRGVEAANIIGEEYAKFFSVQKEYHRAINAKEPGEVISIITDIATKLSLIYPAPVEACLLYGASILLYIWLNAFDRSLLEQDYIKDQIRVLEKKIEGYADRSELPKLKSYFKKVRLYAKDKNQSYSQKAASIVLQEITKYLEEFSF